MQDRLAHGFRFLARLSLGQAIIFLPFRFRFSLVERPRLPLYRDFTDILLFVSDFFILFTLIFWTASLIAAYQRFRTGPIFLSLPIAALTGMGIMGSFTSIQPELTLYHAVRLLFLFGIYLFLVNESHPWDYILPAVGIQLSIQSTAGIAQYGLQRSLGLQSLGERILDPLQSGVSVVWVEGTRILRAYGLTDHPNMLGGCLAFSLILLLLWQSKSSLRVNFWITGLFALGMLCLLLTYSRSAWLAFLAGGIFSAVLLLKDQNNSRRLKALRLIGAGFILIVPFVGWNLNAIGVRLNWQGSFQSVAQENQSLGERQLLNSAAVQIFQEHTWTGTGLGAYPYALQERFPDFPVNYSPAHIVVLDAAAELGLVGALAHAGASLFPWLVMWLKRKQLAFSPDLIVASGLLLALTTVSFFDYYTWSHLPGRLWQWIAWGLWGMAYGRRL